MKKIVIITLGVLIVSSLTIFCVIKFNDNSKKGIKELSQNEIDDLMEIIDKLYIVDERDENIDENHKLSNQQLLEFAFANTKIIKETNSLYEKEWNYNDLNETVNKYFGIDLIKEDYLCPLDKHAFYKYDTKNDKYIFNKEHLGHGGPEIIDVINLYSSSYSKKDIYTIKVKKAFSSDMNENPDNEAIYNKNYNSYLYPEDDLFEVYGENRNEVFKNAREKVEGYKDELYEYTYTFKKENGNYIFLTYTQENTEHNKREYLNYNERQDLEKIIDKLYIVDNHDENIDENHMLSNQELLKFAFTTKFNEREYNALECPYNDLNEIVNKYFGVDLIKEDFLDKRYNDVFWKYDSKTNKYIYNIEHVGGDEECPSYVANVYSSEYLEKDVYTIKVKKVFSESICEEIPSNYYKTLNNQEKILFSVDYFKIREKLGEGYPENTYLSTYKDKVKAMAEEHKDELNEYTYTFRKQNGNYIFLTYTK